MINGPDFINFNGKGFFEKTAIFISYLLFYTIGKPFKSYLEKIYELFDQSLYSSKKIKKTLFKNFKIS